MAEWSETKLILQELEQLFHREDDVKDIFDIKQMEREIATVSNRQLVQAKDLIKGRQGKGN
jgi:hypothetical protein